MKHYSLTDRSRQLRKNSTDEERILWKALRNRKFQGLKFRRQHPLDYYILNFYCAEKKLAIELDGAYHFTQESIFYDKERSKYITSAGIKILRFENWRIKTDLRKVLEEITAHCNS